MTITRTSAIVLAGLGCAATGSTSEARERPNIILIIADDMGRDDCGAYGHQTIQTPNIDRLAREGMRFDRAFVTASSCSPSRASLMTGRYPHSTDAEQLHWPLPAAQVTFVEKLKAAGYWTAAAGKWHLGNAVKDRFDVVREGYPAAFQLPKGAEAAPAKLGAPGPGDAASGCAQWVPTLRDQPRDRPFLLWLASFDPHRDYEAGTIPRPHRPESAPTSSTVRPARRCPTGPGPGPRRRTFANNR